MHSRGCLSLCWRHGEDVMLHVAVNCNETVLFLCKLQVVKWVVKQTAITIEYHIKNCNKESGFQLRPAFQRLAGTPLLEQRQRSSSGGKTKHGFLGLVSITIQTYICNKEYIDEISTCYKFLLMLRFYVFWCNMLITSYYSCNILVLFNCFKSGP